MKAYEYFMARETVFHREEEQAARLETSIGNYRTNPKRQELMASAHKMRIYYLGKAIDVLEGRLPDVEMGEPPEAAERA